jgi:hypothetical protein
MLGGALGGQREGRQDGDSEERAQDGPEPVPMTLVHWADSPALVMPLKVCENYHPTWALSISDG